MAHFAQLDENNKVIQVIVVHNNELLEDGVESESKGINFCKSLYGDNTKWLQTSYNANKRKHYAGIGFTYDPDFDAFIPPKPYPSWKLNYETFTWDAPFPVPDYIEGYDRIWSEINQEWVQVPVVEE